MYIIGSTCFDNFLAIHYTVTKLLNKRITKLMMGMMNIFNCLLFGRFRYLIYNLIIKYVNGKRGTIGIMK